MQARPIRTTALVAALAVACVLATGPNASAAVVVTGYTQTWSPAVVRIAPGGAVRWHAVSGEHNVKAYGGSWTYFRSLSQGASTRARTFRARGTFRFYCTIHAIVTGGHCSGMCGKVVVR